MLCELWKSRVHCPRSRSGHRSTSRPTSTPAPPTRTHKPASCRRSGLAGADQANFVVYREGRSVVPDGRTPNERAARGYWTVDVEPERAIEMRQASAALDRTEWPVRQASRCSSHERPLPPRYEHPVDHRVLLRFFDAASSSVPYAALGHFALPRTRCKRFSPQARGPPKGSPTITGRHPVSSRRLATIPPRQRAPAAARRCRRCPSPARPGRVVTTRDPCHVCTRAHSAHIPPRCARSAVYPRKKSPLAFLVRDANHGAAQNPRQATVKRRTNRSRFLAESARTLPRVSRPYCCSARATPAAVALISLVASLGEAIRLTRALHAAFPSDVPGFSHSFCSTTRGGPRATPPTES